MASYRKYETKKIYVSNKEGIKQNEILTKKTKQIKINKWNKGNRNKGKDMHRKQDMKDIKKWYEV